MNNSLLILFLLILCSCASNKVVKYGEIDLSNKSITVPKIEHSRIIFGIKSVLRQRGFRIVSDTGGYKHSRVSDKVAFTRDEHTTRYSLVFESQKVELMCFNDLELFYSISVIDNLNGQEVFNLSGKNCGRKIPKKFDESFK